LTSNVLEFQIIHYEPLYSDANLVYNTILELSNDFKEKGEDNVNIRVLAYFYEGMLYIIKADDFFKQKDFGKSFEHFEEGLKLINRSRASRGREGDQIFDEMIKWISYTEGMKKLCSSFSEEDIDKKLSLVDESIKNFENFLEARKNEKNQIDEIVAKARINFAKYLYKKIESAKYIENSKKYKRYLLDARSKLMKANFLYRSFDAELTELQNLIDEITKQHIVNRAEGFWDQGTVNIINSNFKAALRLFTIASEYYSRASEICENFMEQRLYLALSKITEASSIEANANELYKRNDKPQDASKKFSEAVEVVDIALGLLTSIKSETLINNMTAQRSFYEALSLETEGIYMFDSENFAKAHKKFEQAIAKLDETQIKATEGNIDQLLEFVRTSKSEIEGYISMTKAMI